LTGRNFLRTRLKLATNSGFKTLHRPVCCRRINSATFFYTSGVRFTALITIIVLLSPVVFADAQTSVPVMRWTENTPNCSIRQGDDGRTYYTLSSPAFEITLAVDPKELEKIPHRATPMLTVSLAFTYKGKGQFEIHQRRFALEFSKHRQVVKTSLEPNDIIQHLQEDVDSLTDQVERHEVRKHPEQKEQKEAELQARLKDYTEMMDFVSTQSLRYTVLSPAKPAISGWVFFSVKDRWIGPWRKPEQFILRLRVADLAVEFPFSLPPQSGAIELRLRTPEPSQ
jgi:hypothetical protein